MKSLIWGAGCIVFLAAAAGLCWQQPMALLERQALEAFPLTALPLWVDGAVAAILLAIFSLVQVVDTSQ